MTIDTASTRNRLKAGDLRNLFIEELGWDNFRGSHRITVGADTYALTGVAEKRGAQVFVCDNMCFRGEITVMKKHTRNIIESLQTELVAAIYSSVGNFELIHVELERLKTVEISDEFGYRTLGSLAGNEILMPTELNEAYRQWKEPQYESFKPRTAYSLYNAVTCGLRDVAPHRTFQVHRDVHEAIIAEYLPPVPSIN